jgi:hypothetical protein
MFVISREQGQEAQMQATVVTNALNERDIDDTPIPRAAGWLVLSAAEVAPCTCPDWCERDHDRD